MFTYVRNVRVHMIVCVHIVGYFLSLLLTSAL